MNLTNWIDTTANLSNPPPGSINVRVGRKIEGPGGKWVPCATMMRDGSYCSGLFQVGPGQRQICAASLPMGCPDEALSMAIELASAAAA